MGPITKEIVQQGLLDYLTIIALFEPDKNEKGLRERGITLLEPQEITSLFTSQEYMGLYRASAGILARLLESPEKKKRELAYAIHGAHLRVKRVYDEQKEYAH